MLDRVDGVGVASEHDKFDYHVRPRVYKLIMNLEVWNVVGRPSISRRLTFPGVLSDFVVAHRSN